MNLNGHLSNVRPGLIVRTNPDADADYHGNARSAMAQGFQRINRHIATVRAHCC